MRASLFRPAPSVDPVEQVLPPGQMAAIGLQHVLVMYAGAIAVPLIVGAALHLPKDQLADLIDADLFACGIATLLQCIGFPGVGIRLPVVMGVTFASVGPIIALADAHLGLPVIYGSILASGAFAIAIAPIFSRLLRFFPPVVTGTVITTIGITLLEVGIEWAGGGAGSKNFGSPVNVMLASLVLIAILAINRFVRGFWANIAVLLGLAIGFLAAVPLGVVDFSGVAQAQTLAIVRPFRFGLPRFDAGAIVSLCVVMLVIMVESTGMFFALGELCDRPLDRRSLVRGLRADGAGALIGGCFNPFPYTSFSQNVGLVGMTGVRSRWAVATSGAMLVVLGLFPKLATAVASIPPAVLGGAGIAMFGMVAASGIKILGEAGLRERHNSLIVAVSLGIGMIPLVAPALLNALPSWAGPFAHSGITLAACSAVLLNILFNGGGPTIIGDARRDVEELMAEAVG
ncbi:MAG: purine permease [Candidatus Eremiobacteraeota bacterium]|nr:purine permease [Candidatus Eremiobacteraeota bacterium]